MGRFSHKRILITGGCGFIGSHLAKRLENEGADLLVFSRNPSACPRLKDIKCLIEKVSVSDAKTVERHLRRYRPHFVFHLAALVNPERSLDLFDPEYKINVEGTKNILKPLIGMKTLTKFIHAGTIEEYGRGRPPFREQDREWPVSPYSATKLIATRLVEYFAKEEELPAVIIRPSLIYGPGQGFGRFLTNLIRACLQKEDFRMAKGIQTRDLLYIDDLVDGMLKTALSPGIDGEIINLGSGKEIPVREVARLVNRIFKNPIKIHFGALPFRRGEMMHFWLDSSKAKKLLGWKSRVGIEEGLKKTIDWYKENWKKLPS